MTDLIERVDAAFSEGDEPSTRVPSSAREQPEGGRRRSGPTQPPRPRPFRSGRRRLGGVALRDVVWPPPRGLRATVAIVAALARWRGRWASRPAVARPVLGRRRRQRGRGSLLALVAPPHGVSWATAGIGVALSGGHWCSVRSGGATRARHDWSSDTSVIGVGRAGRGRRAGDRRPVRHRPPTPPPTPHVGHRRVVRACNASSRTGRVDDGQGTGREFEDIRQHAGRQHHRAVRERQVGTSRRLDPGRPDRPAGGLPGGHAVPNRRRRPRRPA